MERHHSEIERLQRVADWLDSRFRIPGTGIRFGLDSVLGLVPIIGDGAVMLPALYLILRARQLGASHTVIARMIVNVLIDLSIGAIPVVGDLFDVGFKANRRNIALLRTHLQSVPRTRRARGSSSARFDNAGVDTPAQRDMLPSDRATG